MTDQRDIDEYLALRNGAQYQLFDEEPTAGRWWALKAVPCAFPSPGHALATPDGAPVEQHAIVIAERRKDSGLWQWAHPTWACKKFFGDMLFENTTERDRWYYIVETDR